MIFDSGDTGDAGGGYTITNSLRFRSSGPAYIERTTSTPTSPYKACFVFFVKPGVTSSGSIYAASTGSGTSAARFTIRWDSGNILEVAQWNGASYDIRVSTNRVFRDYSGHMMVKVTIDTTQATASNRVKIQINGDAFETSFGSTTYPSLNSSPYCCLGGKLERIGYSTNPGEAFDGYLSEFRRIDGWTTEPAFTDFLEYDSVVTNWLKPKRYAGSYGANGFYLDFSTGTSLTTLGYDKSGNGNNWTLNNISLTAGVTYDWMLDSPTMGVGAVQPVGNYATLNPLNSAVILTTGNLTFNRNTASWGCVYGSIGISSGKWVWYHRSKASGSVFESIGIAREGESLLVNPGYNSTSYAYNSFDGNKRNNVGSNGGGTAYGATYSSGDVIRVELNMDAGTLEFFKQTGGSGSFVSQGVAYTGLSGTYFPFFGMYGSEAPSVNFGQQPFGDTPTTGFKALCTSNLPTPTGAAGNPRKHFDVLLHTGNGGTQSVTGAQFTPDFAITKARSQANSHTYYDRVRGATNALFSNTTGAEINYSAYLAGFLSDGVSFIGGGGDTNQSGQTYVDWLWKAGGAAVSNTSGTITSQVSANTDAGFSIVTYTGTGANATVGHGLGVAPKFIIVKARSGGTYNWNCYHASLGSPAADYFIGLNTTDARTDYTAANLWNRTAPTSSVFSIGSHPADNNSGTTFVAYCFAEISGYSKFGSYTGNGSSDGPFVFCGFRPRYVLIKCSSNTGLSWAIVDTARNTFNVTNAALFANASDTEFAAQNICDVTANGFKIRVDQTLTNGSGYTYIYAAFADLPFQFALAR